MAPRAIVASKVWLDTFDVSSDLTAFALSLDANPEDISVLDGSGTRRYSPMLESGSFSLAGIWQAGTDKINEILATRFALQNTLLTVVPETGADLEAAYLLRVLEAQYDGIVGAVGSALRFKASGGLSNACVRGFLLSSGNKAASGNGSVLTLAGPILGQKLYGSLHVLSMTGGGTLTCKIQSAPTLGFAAPVDRISFAGTTVRTTQWATPVAGPITDGFWRATWTLTAGSAVIAISLGIQ